MHWCRIYHLKLVPHIPFHVPNSMCPALCRKAKLKRPAAASGQKPYGYKKEVNAKFRDKEGLAYSASTEGSTLKTNHGQSVKLKSVKQRHRKRFAQ